ncbi:hypothetical protein EG68_04226 [Paragonimus skrjabini miyazakii]|uniref:EGF-like domain-containing protein n=1 Tax=Paragonimus skrjabini miyazakii TaxID=59628 RepID=A0A8S9Z1U9_9TREM|nr:hypothetical protein EG68_04226 [Paragonimus skrjabini miyazakii]
MSESQNTVTLRCTTACSHWFATLINTVINRFTFYTQRCVIVFIRLIIHIFVNFRQFALRMNISRSHVVSHCFNDGVCRLFRIRNDTLPLQCLKCACPEEWAGKRCEERVSFPKDCVIQTSGTNVALIIIVFFLVAAVIGLVIYAIYTHSSVRKFFVNMDPRSGAPIGIRQTVAREDSGAYVMCSPYLTADDTSRQPSSM